MIHPQLNVNISDDESKITTYTCIWKVDWSFFKHDTVLLTDYDHDLFIEKIVSFNRIEYDKNETENKCQS